MDANARAELQDANDRLLHLIEQDHLEEVRLAAKDRKWMTDPHIPEDLRRRLEDCYDALARALTPEERGLRDVPQAREECRRAAEILKGWRNG